jgi:predicted ABC-type ATPase
MTEQLFLTFLKGAQDQGFVAIMFVIAIWYVQKRVDRLEEKILECENDRKSLWERLISQNHK